VAAAPNVTGSREIKYPKRSKYTSWSTRYGRHLTTRGEIQRNPSHGMKLRFNCSDTLQFNIRLITHDTVNPKKKKKISGINAVPSVLRRKRALSVMLKNATSGIPITET
jgi:LysM repeat protein